MLNHSEGCHTYGVMTAFLILYACYYVDKKEVGHISMITVMVRKVNETYIESHYDEILLSLYSDRRESVCRYKNRQAAYVSVTAGLMLQDVARKELGITPECMQIERGEYGKPFIKGYETFCYNISHSGEYVVLAYGDQPMGIDIEEIRDKNLDVAKRCFTEREYEYVTSGYRDGTGKLESETEQERFFQIWTMKESYLKLTGAGISVPLNSFEVDPYNMCVRDTEYQFDGRGIADYHVTVCASDVSKIVYVFAE